MGFFSNLFSAAKPAMRKAIATPISVPPSLPRLGTQSATAIAQRAEQTPLVGAPDQPPAYLEALIRQQKPVEAAGVLAYGLPEMDAVRWAIESADLVAVRQTPADLAATQAGKQWLAWPTAANQAAAVEAAKTAEFGGPGAWAAQAAAWATPIGSTETGTTTVAATPNPLVGKAVLGSVMLSVALSKPGVQLPVVPKLDPAVELVGAVAGQVNPSTGGIVGAANTPLPTATALATAEAEKLASAAGGGQAGAVVSAIKAAGAGGGPEVSGPAALGRAGLLSSAGAAGQVAPGTLTAPACAAALTNPALAKVKAGADMVSDAKSLLAAPTAASKPGISEKPTVQTFEEDPAAAAAELCRLYKPFLEGGFRIAAQA